MRYITSIIFVMSFYNVFAQTQNFVTSIPKCYDCAKEFYIVNNQKDTLIAFQKNGIISYIPNDAQNYTLAKRRKLLLSPNGDTIAVYKRKKIILPKQNIVVAEKKQKHGWQYFQGDKKILEINYNFNKAEKRYYITSTTAQVDENTINLMQMALGKFQNRVVMDYDNTNAQLIGLVVGDISATLLTLLLSQL